MEFGSTGSFVAAAQRALDNSQPLRMILVSPSAEAHTESINPQYLFRFYSDDTAAISLRPQLTVEFEAADIAMQSAQLVNGNTVQFTYETTGNPGPFQVGLYRSTDGITYNPADQIAAKNVTPGSAGATDAFTLASPIEGSEDYPYLLVVADPANAIEESNEDNNAASISVPWMAFTYAALQDIDGSYLRYLSVSDDNPYFNHTTRVNGVFSLRGTPADALTHLRLEIDQGGVTRAAVDLIPQATGFLRPFGDTGVIEAADSQLLFAVPESVADAIDTSQDDYLFLRMVAISAQGVVAKSDYGLVPVLTRYTGSNRYGPRDRARGGDDWVLPSVRALLGTFTGVLWGDMSNMNGGSFLPDHAGHTEGDEADFTLTGLKSPLNDPKSGKTLAAVINALPQGTYDQITLMYATVDEKYLKQLKNHLRDDRKSFVERVNWEPGHDTHFHFIFRGAPTETDPFPELLASVSSFAATPPTTDQVTPLAMDRRSRERAKTATTPVIDPVTALQSAQQAAVVSTLLSSDTDGAEANAGQSRRKKKS